MMPNHEEDLLLTSTMTEQIKKAVNTFGKSNYTFKLIEQEDKEGIYFLNLIVKEYKDTFYMYIVSYVPDLTWLKSSYNKVEDIASFTGTVYFYNSDGIFVAKSNMNLGISTNMTNRNICPHDGATGGGGDPVGDTGGSGEESSESESGSNADSTGEGGSGPVVEIRCSCLGHNWIQILNSECSCSTFVFVYADGSIGPTGINRSMRDVVDCPTQDAEEVCYMPNGDPCINGCDPNGHCIENPDEVENGVVGITADPKALVLLDYILTPDLTSSQMAWIELNSTNEKFATAIYNHFESQEGFFGNLNPEGQVVAQKILDIFMGLSDTDVLSSVYEHETFAAIVGRGITATQPVLFEEHEEAYSNIDPDNVLSLTDMAVISEKVWENGLLVLALPPAILFNQYELAVSISTQIIENDSFIAMLAHVKSLAGEHWPQNLEEYEAIGTFMVQFMGEVGLAFIPGSGIIDAFQAAEQEDYLTVTFALATVIADFFGGTIIKVVAKVGKVGYKAFKIFRLAYKYLVNVASGIADDIIKALLDEDTLRILSETGDDIAKIIDDVMEISHHGIKAVENSVIFRNANEANGLLAQQGYDDPPFSGVVTEFVSQDVEQFVRFHNTSNPNRSWMMKLSDVQYFNNLDEVRNIFSLNIDNAISHVSTITVPNGSKIMSGTANGLYGFDGGGYQFFVDEIVDGSWVSNTQSIIEFFN
jgi:hypothetical protein